MNLFKIVKTTVTVKQAAALYGLPITTTGMTRCPFHEDHTPSMTRTPSKRILPTVSESSTTTVTC